GSLYAPAAVSAPETPPPALRPHSEPPWTTPWHALRQRPSPRGGTPALPVYTRDDPAVPLAATCNPWLTPGPRQARGFTAGRTRPRPPLHQPRKRDSHEVAPETHPPRRSRARPPADPAAARPRQPPETGVAGG